MYVDELHELFNSSFRFAFPFEHQKGIIPKNGIYLIFENGEGYKKWDRIVRIGTHTGDNQLHSRLKQHFVKNNKNRSIFRKNIGRCFLNRDNHKYLQRWELDTTSRREKEMNQHLIDVEFERQLEKEISDYIQSNLSFVVLEINDKSERLFWEQRVTSTLSGQIHPLPSQTWLGNYSPKEKIREFGLWQVNQLGKQPLSKKELQELREVVWKSSDPN
ncbi:hypothetical protein QQ008_07480 [Fulvivirgaceae bacterium BMA10]|uniref:GIY-YIG domain-containing protein n=1 Tax=Splendidivirga corallicola TaxID=3051826 RepID=A0ABT8KKF6_9BACT|nr:hypothetical protein [Fulvivirgaceae bacterium BMA10]